MCESTSDWELSKKGEANEFNSNALRASIDQAGPTSLTAPVLITIPAGLYALTGPLSLSSSYVNNQSVTIGGEDPATTILDGGNSVLILKKTIISSAPVNIENSTLTGPHYDVAINNSTIYQNGLFLGLISRWPMSVQRIESL